MILRTYKLTDCKLSGCGYEIYNSAIRVRHRHWRTPAYGVWIAIAFDESPDFQKASFAQEFNAMPHRLNLF
jgi:hypothetical protein